MKMGVMRRRPSLVLVSICLLCCSQTNVIPLHHCSRLQWTAMHILNITLSLDHQSYLLLRWSSSLGRKGRSFHRLDASHVTQPTVSKQSHATTNAYNTHTHTRPFNGPFSGTIRVSRYQKGKTIWILLKQETVSGSGISRATCKSAPRSRHITTPAPHHSVFYRLDAPPTTQPRVSKQSHAATHAYNTIRTLSLNSYTPANYEVFKKKFTLFLYLLSLVWF